MPTEHEHVKARKDQEEHEKCVVTLNGAHERATGKTESDEDVREWVDW